MLRPIPMAKVAVVGPKGRLERAVGVLQELGVLHIEDYQPGETGFDLGSPLPDGAKVSERLLRVRGLMKSARMEAPAPGMRFTPENLRALQARLGEVETELSHLVEERGRVLDEAKRMDEERAVLERVRNLPLPLELTGGYRSLASVAGFLPPDADPGVLAKVHADGEVLASVEAEGSFVVAWVPRSAERALQEAATRLQLSPLELPTAPGTPADRLRALDAQRQALRTREADLESKISSIRQRHGAAFFALDEYLGLLADRATVPVRFRTTRNAFMIEGWVPRNELSRLKSVLGTATDHQTFVTELPSAATQPWKHERPVHAAHATPSGGDEAAGTTPAHEEEPPVHLEYGRAKGGYQLLTDTYSRPKYSEIDPTLFFYFGFPFFYGFMLGDIGYGALLLLLVFGGVLNKVYRFFGFESRGALNKVFRHCAYASIAFGLLYSELFGLELFGQHGLVGHYHAQWGFVPYPLARFENVKLLLYVSLAIAAVHMAIGLILGLRNASAAHGWAHAWKHRGSWLFILLGVSVAAVVGLPGILQLEGIAPGNPTPFYVVAGILFLGGLVLLLAGEGGIALLELPTILSNMLSYSRLVAIGLSGAGIALAGNKVANLFLDGSAVGYVVAGFVLLFFHALNLALGILGPSLHSLRLHYVEFFTKFYEGGGRPYAPFRAERRYTTKEVRQA